MSARPSPVLVLAGVLAPGVVGLVVLMLVAGAATRLSTEAQWLLVPVVLMLFAAGAATRLRMMGYGRTAVVAVGSGYAVLLALAALWGLLTGDLVRAAGLVLLAAASVGLACAVVAVVVAIGAERRATRGR
jgi:hypothetical protein